MNTSLRSDIPYILFGLFTFGVVVLRAIYLPPYSDELNTFFTYVQTGFFQPFMAHLDANNHVLNSLFTHLSYLAFGSKMIALRLPNVLSFLVYLFYLWKLGKTFKSKYLGFSWFVTMITSLYLLSFFSLSRGYGMSMAFLVASFYYLIIYSSTSKHKYLYAGLVMSSLALWANLSLMIPLLVLGAIFMFLYVQKVIASQLPKQIAFDLIAIISLYLIPLIYAILYSFDLKNSRLLYHGGTFGFIDSVVLHLAAEYSGFYPVGIGVFGVLFLIYVIASISNIIGKRNKGSSFYFQLLFWGTIIGTILLHLILDINYPQDRAAIHFFVLFMAVFFFNLDQFNKKTFRYFGPVIALALTIQLFISMNLRYVPHWKQETVPISFYNLLSQWHQKTGVLPTISANGILGKVFEHYGFHHGETLNSTQDKEFPSKIADFLITSHWVNKNFIIGYDTLQYDKETGVSLMQRKNRFEWQQVLSHSEKKNFNSKKSIFFLEIPAEQFLKAPFCYDISFKAQSKRFPFRCWIVCDVFDDSNKSLSYNSIDLQRVKSDIRQTSFIHRRLYLETIPKDAKKIRFYLWNVDKETVNISDLQITMFKGLVKHNVAHTHLDAESSSE